jgi:hypothetical protein
MRFVSGDEYMPFLKNITQRLFGRTVIDSLDLNQNAWYIDEEQVTVTAANLNGTSVLPATSQTVDIANDDVLFLDHSGSHAFAYDSIPDLMNLVCGTAANTGLASSAGVITVTPSDNAVTVGTDSLMYITQAGVPKKDLISDFTTAIAGTGLLSTSGVLSLELNEVASVAIDPSVDEIVFIDQATAGDPTAKATISSLVTAMAGEGLGSASAGVLNLKDDGQTSHGGVFFTGVGDCTSVDINAIVYERDDTPDVTLGQWASGAGAAAAATNLAAGINGDTRNAGGPYFTAEAIGAGVVIRALTPGTAGNVTVARTGGAEPSTTQNLVEGRAAKACKIGTVYHTVTAFDVLLTEFTLELPFSPDTFIVQVRDSTGAIKTVTDTFNFDGSPLGVVVTFAGATHLIAGDIITVISISL